MRLALRLAYLSIALLSLLQIVTVSAQEDGYIYTVQPGDSWPLVARRVGLTVSELQEANPDAVRANGWLIVGELLFIPNAPGWEERFYIAQRGDGWITVAEKFGLTVDLLQAANPKLLRPGNALIVGERMLIPALLPTPTGEPSPVASSPTSTPTAEEAPLVIAATSEPDPFFAPRISFPLPTPVTLPPCPDAPTDLGQTLTDLFGIPASNRYAQLTAFLADCGAELKILASADLNADRVDDAVLVYTPADSEKRNPVSSAVRRGTGPSGSLGIQQELAILSGGRAHSLSFATTANGTIELLATQDINADDLTDVVWTDTVCGSNTCFLTVHVRSWDGVAWRDWTKGTITMASANVSLTSGSEQGMPKEIRLTGGEYTGADAGPQRARTAVWTSTDGAPYALSGESLAPSGCLYHTLFDANHALVDERYLEKALWLYTEAVENSELNACWKRRNELSELRSFALFRLALTLGYQNEPLQATEQVQRLESQFSNQIYADVARRWLDVYQQSGDPRTACKVVSVFAAVTPGVVDILADFGYANPTFTAEDVCPILEIESQADPEPSLAQIEGLPDCPSTSADYISALPAVVNLVAGGTSGNGDEQGAPSPFGPVEAWLRACGALSDGRGGLLIYDLNEDGLDDVIAVPTILSDDGYGPDGADGVILILHQQVDGSYQTAYAPNASGEPKILAIGDANGDGKADLVWQLERCTTFCLLRVHAITWDSETASYQSVIGSGAEIAEGAASLDMALEATSTHPRIRRLWLNGGASGTDGDGLTVAHTEIWYSVDGLPMRRFTWSYDRSNEASNCLGLRLVETNVTLEAAGPGDHPSGYATAIEMYRDVLESPELRPCSTQGTDPEEEMTLLRGLASFRLVQALTLSGDRSTAEEELETLTESESQSRYTEAARAWLDAYYSVPDPVAACAAVMSIFLDSPDLWQITEEFGADHPALSVRQVCYVPGSGEGFDFRLTPNW